VRAVSHDEVYTDDWPADAAIRLWSTVISQALHDASCPHESDEARQDRDEAREWLLGDGHDFRLVAHLAGLDPDAVREAAVKMAARGWPRPQSARTRVTSFDDHEEFSDAQEVA
jgi:hypothetical protein